VVHEVQPHQCYHLAAQSFVSYSFDDEFSTLNININNIDGTHFLLADARSPPERLAFWRASRTSCGWAIWRRNATGARPRVRGSHVADAPTAAARRLRGGPLFRPAEVNLLRGDASKARRVLDWTHHIGFQELVREMVDDDCRAVGIERGKG